MKSKRSKTFISLERWKKLSFAEQMANIGADVARAIRAQEMGDKHRMDNAIIRTMQQFDLSIKAHEGSPAKLNELFHSRGLFCDLISENSINKNDAKSLDKYFLEFNFLARKNV